MLPEIQNTRRILISKSTEFAKKENKLRNLPSIVEEVDRDYWQTVSDSVAAWIRSSIATIRSMYQAALAAGRTVPNAQRVFNELRLIETALQYLITLPPY